METAAKLEAHERECAIRYISFREKLDHSVRDVYWIVS